MNKSSLFISDNPTAIYTGLTDTPIGRFETAEDYSTRIQPLFVGWMWFGGGNASTDLYILKPSAGKLEMHWSLH